MNFISKFIHQLSSRIVNYAHNYQVQNLRTKLGFCDPSAIFKLPRACSCPSKVFLYENTSLYEGAKLIISGQGESGRFIMRSNSYAAQGLTVITGSHKRVVGLPAIVSAESRKYDINKDVVIEEDVSIGTDVTLLSGVTVGRGSVVAAGSVCTTNVPPYALVMGNPAQVIGFCFTPEEIITHEQKLYPEEQRLPTKKIEKNYQKFYINQLQKITGYLNLTLS